MTLTARDVMQATVKTVSEEMSLLELDREFLLEKVSGFPVVRGERLVGVVSRSDVVRQLSVESSVSEIVSDYYHDVSGLENVPLGKLEDITERMGEHLDNLRVRDFMTMRLVTVAPELGVRDVARILVERRIHRVPVVDDGRLVGIITTFDLTRLIAEDRV